MGDFVAGQALLADGAGDVIDQLRGGLLKRLSTGTSG
jgi:pantoate kinase